MLSRYLNFIPLVNFAKKKRQDVIKSMLRLNWTKYIKIIAMAQDVCVASHLKDITYLILFCFSGNCNKEDVRTDEFI